MEAKPIAANVGARGRDGHRSRAPATRRGVLAGLALGASAALVLAMAGSAAAQLAGGGTPSMEQFEPKQKEKQWKMAPDVAEADEQRQAQEEARIQAELAAQREVDNDYIFGVHINTLFFIALGVAAVFWFTLGGGRKAKIGRDKP